MNEKLTDRIGLVSLFLATLLYFAQIICVIIWPNFALYSVLFIAYNICIAVISIMYLRNDRKFLKVLNVIRIMTIMDIVAIVSCLIAFGIKMLVI